MLHLLHERGAIQVFFDETLFDVNSVKVMFYSNCTDPVTVKYRNPIKLIIPDTGMHTGLCQYMIQLQLVGVNYSQIGYPIVGFFQVEGLCITD